MKRLWRPNGAIFLCLVFFCFGVSVGLAATEPMVLTAKDSGRTVTVGVGQRLVVDLELGTGHQVVAPEFNAEVLSLVGQSLQSITGPKGASTRIIYEFFVRQAGRSDLVIDVRGSRKEGKKAKPLLKIKIVASGGGQTI